MKIWKLSQSEQTGYDTYSAVIVAAKTEKEAKNIFPSDVIEWEDQSDCWCSSPDQVQAELIGTAVRGTKKGIILASYHAG